MIRTSAVGLWMLLALACSTQDRVIMVDDKDPEMIAAIAEARAHVNEFVVALKAPQPGDRSFGIKAALRDGQQVEHVWIDDVVYDGSAFSGTLGNDPELVKGHSLGESVRVVPGEISDWMYVRQDRLVGGYSIRLLRRRLTASERTELDEGLDFRVE